MPDLEQVFAEAAKIAKGLPENLQEAAFNRALDELLGGAELGLPPREARTASARTKVKREPRSSAENVSDVVDSIDRTKYPDIGATNRMADRALKVLQLVNEDLRIDGLSANQIADILVRKFRLPAKVNAVQMALQRESQTVDVRSGPDGRNVFHIMAAGDEYLKKLRAGSIEPKGRRGGKPSSKKAVKKRAVREKSTSEKASGKKTGVRRSAIGPKAAIGKLIETGYFSTPRQISEIQEELKHKKGHGFTVQELSPAWVRCVRDETLSRSRTESGQYEYSKT